MSTFVGSSQDTGTSEASTRSRTEYHAVRLTANQIGSFWDSLREAILSSLPPVVTPDAHISNRMLKNLLESQAQCWVLYGMTEGKSEIVAVCMTRVQEDFCTGTRTLTILSLYGYRRAPKEAWQQGLKTLKDFARTQGCSKVLAYTQSDRVKALGRDTGASLDHVLVKWEI